MDDPGLSFYFIILILLCASAFFSASETAFSSLNMIRIKTMAEEEENKKAEQVAKVVDDYDRFLTTILIGNNLVNIAFSSLITLMVEARFNNYTVAIATGISTLLVLTFGEIFPKSLAKANAEKWALAVVKVIQTLMTVLFPLSWLFLKLGKVFHQKEEEEEKAPTMTEQEFLYMLDTIEEEGVLEEGEKKFMESAVDFYDSTVQEIVTPRVNIVAIDIEYSQEKILETIKDERFSRIPVYEGTIDNIVGIVQSRDILETVIEGKKVNLKKMMVEPMYIHRTMKISKLLSDFQKKKTHIAVVIDDYGGTQGIVTMEDLLEELVGEIWDEDEEIVEEFSKKSDDTYEVSGDMSAEEFFEEIDYHPENEDGEEWNTLSGWAMDCLGHIPDKGETFLKDRLSVTVNEVDDQMIQKMKIVLLPEEEKQDD